MKRSTKFTRTRQPRRRFSVLCAVLAVTVGLLPATSFAQCVRQADGSVVCTPRQPVRRFVQAVTPRYERSIVRSYTVTPQSYGSAGATSYGSAGGVTYSAPTVREYRTVAPVVQQSLSTAAPCPYGVQFTQTPRLIVTSIDLPAAGNTPARTAYVARKADGSPEVIAHATVDVGANRLDWLEVNERERRQGYGTEFRDAVVSMHGGPLAPVPGFDPLGETTKATATPVSKPEKFKRPSPPKYSSLFGPPAWSALRPVMVASR
jgi:hypothetical protein